MERIVSTVTSEGSSEPASQNVSQNASQNPPTNVSLSDVHRSVEIPSNVKGWKRFVAFFGPAYLVSVGYMDPGNWATDLEGGARFGYTLIWVLVMSNIMAILLQTLSARLGIVTGRDLAQACRDNLPAPVAYALWVLAEIAIAATDLAEVLGTAIGINLLFGIPVFWGVVIAGFDTFLLLAIQNLGVRKFEAFVISLVAIVGTCFLVELFLSKPDLTAIAGGMRPHLPEGALYVAIGIIGATVMPHNLYLHSALVQTRAFEHTPEGKRSAAKFNLIDSAVALNAALFVNAAILILAASTFYKNGVAVTELQQAHKLLSPMLGTSLAGVLFAIALLAAGQSSTLTGTLAGQVVMEGFLQFKIRPLLRRLVTRMIALLPAMYVLLAVGEVGMYQLLIFSQVVLSLQLAFAVIPLIHFTSSKRLMGEFANKPWVQAASWSVATVIVVLNLNLVAEHVSNTLESTDAWWLKTLIAAGLGVLGTLLLYIIIAPLVQQHRERGQAHTALLINPRKQRKKVVSMLDEGTSLAPLDEPRFHRVGVTVAFSDGDIQVLAHAQALARQHGATLCLFHVVEGAGSVMFGNDAFDAEAREDEMYLQRLAATLAEQGIPTEAHLGFGDVPKAIIQLATTHNIDVLIMGGHGHRGLSDIVFGTTISPVRHGLTIPMIIVR
jgi:manganese transport protein